MVAILHVCTKASDCSPDANDRNFRPCACPVPPFYGETEPYQIEIPEVFYSTPVSLPTNLVPPHRKAV